ncbi:MAG: TAT-variant-translocated molybdopterin oxidoreductase [Myxococcales bacterium]|nr:TAT-variant-translocated molybdopterin oxidoreductase [Myxococcales bacterium]MCB9583037.1 TAT-variant-translocated molybdopterin oxidoreductase [Polyangiaceae bacterium]
MSSLKQGQKPTYWRSLAELEDTPEFREYVEREFATPLEELPPGSPGRRRFLQIMGASLALAGATGCRWQEDKLMPLSRRPEGRIPGEPERYATATELAGVAVGIVATSYEGRPIKLEGNPAHPANKGALGVLQQTQVLGVYDPDRSRHPMQKNQAKTWADFENFAKAQFAALKSKQGAGLRILSEASSSPSVAALREELTQAFPQAKWVEWEAALAEGSRGGTALAFGKPHRVLYDFGRADVVVALDADFIDEVYPNGLVNARGLMGRRDPDGHMNRIYAVESTFTQVGSIADHRLPLRSELVKAFAAALDAAVTQAAGGSGAQSAPKAAFLADAKVSKFLQVLAKDLAGAKGKSVVVAGEHQPPEVHAIVAHINSVLGNAGATVLYVEDQGEAQSRVDQLKALVGELNGGQVDTLLILGGNPVYDAPADLGFASALGKAKTSIHLSLYPDETSRMVEWHLPRAHWLESWGDVTAPDGTVSIAQPLIEPLFGGRSVIEVLALVTGSERQKGVDIVKNTHKSTLGDPRAWRKAVHDGVVAGPPVAVANPELKEIAPVALSDREQGGLEVGNGQLEILFAADAKLFDGRFSNLAWMQEAPETFTKLSWGNAAVFAVSTAKALGITDGQHVTLTFGGKSITLPAMLMPGQAPGSVRVTLGYGRKAAGTVGGDDKAGVEPVGADTYQLRTTAALHFGGGLDVKATATLERLPTTQDVWAIDQIGREGADSRLGMLVREARLEEYEKEPTFAKHAVHHPPLLNLWQGPVSYEGHKWGMSIDLSRCMGCSACITACQAENNIATVGKENVVKGREMLWLRVDRYYRGTPEEAEIAWQPLPCMQCENAPCEQVCPVGATMHSHEGLNDMVYNRCIGTRYCANNCPYKVRRFNYFNYHLDKQAATPFQGFQDDRARVKGMVYNPDVSLRARGVMEKCTFCVQRIQNTKIKAKNAKQPIEDGTIQTACQQTCPTEAIVFGDLNDKGSKVAQLQNGPRSYGLLEELNNRPRVRYLARVKNPNPELS